jgi:uncharacterized coiled-coil DUF342 family protein
MEKILTRDKQDLKDIDKIKEQIAMYKREITRKRAEADKKALELEGIYDEIKEYQGVVGTLEMEIEDSKQGELF